MMSPQPVAQTLRFFDWLKGDPGLPGRLALSWSIAGGLTMEVALVAAAFLSGTPDAPALPFTAGMFFVTGAAGGFLHGALVGIAGRPPYVRLRVAWRAVVAGALWAIPCLMVGWVAALWISMTSVALALGRIGMIAAVVAGWIACMVACSWALLEAKDGLAHAMRRWPERRPGGPLVVATFSALVVLFVWYRPEIWFTDLRVSVLGALILSVGATVWIVLPVIVLVLHLLHKWTSTSPVWGLEPPPEQSQG